MRARSPRVRRPQYGDRVRRLIYEDVARDWYYAYHGDEDEEDGGDNDDDDGY